MGCCVMKSEDVWDCERIYLFHDVAQFCSGQANKFVASIKVKEFIDDISEYQLLKNDSVAQSYTVRPLLFTWSRGRFIRGLLLDTTDECNCFLWVSHTYGRAQSEDAKENIYN